MILVLGDQLEEEAVADAPLKKLTKHHLHTHQHHASGTNAHMRPPEDHVPF